MLQQWLTLLPLNPVVGSVPPSFRLKGDQIKLYTALKYLGLWFDGRLTFKEHAKRTAAKAERIIAGISQFMSNQGGRARVSVSF